MNEFEKQALVMGKTYEITNLDKNVKFILECSEHLAFKLFLILLTNYHDI